MEDNAGRNGTRALKDFQETFYINNELELAKNLYFFRAEISCF